MAASEICQSRGRVRRMKGASHTGVCKCNRPTDVSTYVRYCKQNWLSSMKVLSFPGFRLRVPPPATPQTRRLPPTSGSWSVQKVQSSLHCLAEFANMEFGVWHTSGWWRSLLRAYYEHKLTSCPALAVVNCLCWQPSNSQSYNWLFSEPPKFPEENNFRSLLWILMQKQHCGVWTIRD